MMPGIDILLQLFIDKDASDLYLTVGAAPMLRILDRMEPCVPEKLSQEHINAFLKELVSAEIIDEFSSTFEYNTAINWKDQARFRINIFRQQQHTGLVLRRIRSDIPTIAKLGLPPIYESLMMEKRGLILVVGPTSAGKSTSLAAMLEYRNLKGSGHIITIEDPVEFLHEHRNCLVTQRDVGIDTYSFGIGLKNALRQTPDVIVIGEIRDRETMEHAIVFSETGHLCLATLHANNTHQAVERIINFFPEEKHAQVLLNLSFNLRAVLSQRLVRNKEAKRTVAVEIMLNQGLITELIREGRINEIRDCIEKGHASDMQTFDQAMLDLYMKGVISAEVAAGESDNPANVRLAIKQHEMASYIPRKIF